ncbi:MAG: hypothetical protein AB7K71_25690 [Polyangiaceae bacterium]
MTVKSEFEGVVSTAPPNAPESTGAQGAAQARKDGNAFLASGLGIGAFGVASGVLLGAVCPVCVVATPALIGAGVYKRVRAWRLEKQQAERD